MRYWLMSLCSLKKHCWKSYIISISTVRITGPILTGKLRCKINAISIKKEKIADLHLEQKRINQLLTKFMLIARRAIAKGTTERVD